MNTHYSPSNFSNASGYRRADLVTGDTPGLPYMPRALSARKFILLPPSQNGPLFSEQLRVFATQAPEPKVRTWQLPPLDRGLFQGLSAVGQPVSQVPFTRIPSDLSQAPDIGFKPVPWHARWAPPFAAGTSRSPPFVSGESHPIPFTSALRQPPRSSFYFNKPEVPFRSSQDSYQTLPPIIRREYRILPAPYSSGIPLPSPYTVRVGTPLSYPTQIRSRRLLTCPPTPLIFNPLAPMNASLGQKLPEHSGVQGAKDIGIRPQTSAHLRQPNASSIGILYREGRRNSLDPADDSFMDGPAKPQGNAQWGAGSEPKRASSSQLMSLGLRPRPIQDFGQTDSPFISQLMKLGLRPRPLPDLGQADSPSAPTGPPIDRGQNRLHSDEPSASKNNSEQAWETASEGSAGSIRPRRRDSEAISEDEEGWETASEGSAGSLSSDDDSLEGLYDVPSRPYSALRRDSRSPSARSASHIDSEPMFSQQAQEREIAQINHWLHELDPQALYSFSEKDLLLRGLSITHAFSNSKASQKGLFGRHLAVASSPLMDHALLNRENVGSDQPEAIKKYFRAFQKYLDDLKSIAQEDCFRLKLGLGSIRKIEQIKQSSCDLLLADFLKFFHQGLTKEARDLIPFYLQYVRFETAVKTPAGVSLSPPTEAPLLREATKRPGIHVSTEPFERQSAWIRNLVRSTLELSAKTPTQSGPLLAQLKLQVPKVDFYHEYQAGPFCQSTALNNLMGTHFFSPEMADLFSYQDSRLENIRKIRDSPAITTQNRSIVHENIIRKIKEAAALWGIKLDYLAPMLRKLERTEFCIINEDQKVRTGQVTSATEVQHLAMLINRSKEEGLLLTFFKKNQNEGHIVALRRTAEAIQEARDEWIYLDGNQTPFVCSLQGLLQAFRAQEHYIIISVQDNISKAWSTESAPGLVRIPPALPLSQAESVSQEVAQYAAQYALVSRILSALQVIPKGALQVGIRSSGENAIAEATTSLIEGVLFKAIPKILKDRLLPKLRLSMTGHRGGLDKVFSDLKKKFEDKSLSDHHLEQTCEAISSKWVTRSLEILKSKAYPLESKESGWIETLSSVVDQDFGHVHEVTLADEARPLRILETELRQLDHQDSFLEKVEAYLFSPKLMPSPRLSDKEKGDVLDLIKGLKGDYFFDRWEALLKEYGRHNSQCQKWIKELGDTFSTENYQVHQEHNKISELYENALEALSFCAQDLTSIAKVLEPSVRSQKRIGAVNLAVTRLEDLIRQTVTLPITFQGTVISQKMLDKFLDWRALMLYSIEEEEAMSLAQHENYYQGLRLGLSETDNHELNLVYQFLNTAFKKVVPFQGLFGFKLFPYTEKVVHSRKSTE